MNYLEKEIDGALKEHNIASDKLTELQLNILIKALGRKFQKTSETSLSLVELNYCKKEHDPDFWKKTALLTYCSNPILIVCDRQFHAWKFKSAIDVKTLLSETTGFPFWLTDDSNSFLILFDDHDCIHSTILA